jgi:hypothetical protein
VPTPLTREQLLAEVARLRLEAAALNVYADDLEAAAEKAPLTIGSNRATIRSNVQLDLSGKSARVKNAGSRTRKGSAAKQAMLLANKTDADAAEACKVGRSTVNAWVNGTRSIPPQHEKTLAKAPFFIPPGSWPKRG